MLKTDELVVGLPEWGYVYFEAASCRIQVHNLVIAAHG